MDNWNIDIDRFNSLHHCRLGKQINFTIMKKGLSNEAKQILTDLRINKKHFLRKYTTYTGTDAWKRLDENFTPITCYTDNKVQECLQHGYLIRTENGLAFNHYRQPAV